MKSDAHRRMFDKEMNHLKNVIENRLTGAYVCKFNFFTKLYLIYKYRYV